MKKKYKITVNGITYEVEVKEVGGTTQSSENITYTPSTPKHVKPEESISKVSEQIENIRIEAPMPGKILSIKVKSGKKVQEGDVIMILEAMKMENEILAPKTGTISTIEIDEGATVDTGDLLATLE